MFYQTLITITLLSFCHGTVAKAGADLADRFEEPALRSVLRSRIESSLNSQNTSIIALTPKAWSSYTLPFQYVLSAISIHVAHPVKDYYELTFQFEKGGRLITGSCLLSDKYPSWTHSFPSLEASDCEYFSDATKRTKLSEADMNKVFADLKWSGKNGPELSRLSDLSYNELRTEVQQASNRKTKDGSEATGVQSSSGTIGESGFPR